MGDKHSHDKEHITRLAISVAETARALSVTRQHVYALFKTGELGSFKSGRRRLVRLAELDRYISEREKCAVV